MEGSHTVHAEVLPVGGESGGREDGVGGHAAGGGGGGREAADAEVLRADDSPIAGLYAAGACASNIAQDGTGYSSGTCIAESTYFGRRAARHALGC